ncbi:MAG: PIN domain-containing protein [Candidatus Dormibacteraeota bacterium]|nr:PIN domain-containing protein [Candidatus Dormibacteraeota bacterium]
MARVRYLSDTSVFTRLTKAPVVAAFAPLAAEGQVAVCGPVAFELGYSARNRADYVALMDRLAAFTPVAVMGADHERAVGVQAALAERGQHRALSLVDALVAAAAERRDLIVLHYDADFELIAQITGQPQQWIVTRGSGD